MLSIALRDGRLDEVVARGIEPRHFMERPGQKATPQEIYGWAIEHVRQHDGGCPSPAFVRDRWPEWYGESADDTLSALIQAFCDDAEARAFSTKLSELALISHRRDLRGHLGERMLDAARDLVELLPTGSVGRLSEMPSRVDEYERDKATGHRRGFDMGLPVFDELTYGVRPGKVYSIAGFSGLGKSSSALYMLSNIVEQDGVGLLLSLEMTRDEILDRLDTMVMHFSGRLLNRRELPDHEVDRWRRVADVYSRAKSDLIVVDRLAGCTVDRLYAEIERYKPDVTVVDYIQRLRGHTASRAKWEVFDDAANEFKNIAMSTDSSVIICTQDSKAAFETGSTETSGGGSIGIYQASDVYIGMRQNQLMRERKQMEFKILKNRGGQGYGEVMMRWDPDDMSWDLWRGDAADFQKATA